jgi:hypothetical protein
MDSSSEGMVSETMNVPNMIRQVADAQMSDARGTLAQVLNDLAGFVPIATAEIKVGKRYDIRRPNGSFDFWNVEVLETPRRYDDILQFRVTGGIFAEVIENQMIREVAWWR